MGKYDALDDAIIAAVSRGINKFNSLYAVKDLKTGVAMDSLCLDHSFPEGWRALDRRLQALKKKGVISYSRTEGWRKVS